MTTKIKHVASNAITTAELDTSSLDSHFSGGTGVTYSGGAISIGQAVHSTDSPTFADLTVTGNLNITGNIDQYNVTDLDVTDKTITLGSGQIEANSGGSGIIIDGSNASILWDETNTEWDFNKSIHISGSSALSTEFKIGNLTWNQNTSSTSGLLHQYRGSDGYSELQINNTASSGAVTLNIRNDSASVATIANDGGAYFAGNVGIGTTSPGYNLHVEKLSASASVDLLVKNTGTDGTSNSRIMSYVSGASGGDPKIGLGITGVRDYFFRIDNSDSDKLKLDTNGTDIVTIDNSGKVGIGTTSPSGTYGKLTVAGGIRTLDDNDSKLELGRYSSGAANSYIKLGANSASLRITNNNDSADIFTIENGGNVGIGTTDPTGKLHVSGGRAGVISTASSWGQFRVGNTNDAETSVAFVTGATESGFLNGGDPACAYKVILGINPYSAGTRNFGIGNDTITNYHTIWTEAGHQLPRVDNTYDLGATNYGFRNVHLSSDLHVGGNIIGDDDTSYMRMNAGPGGGGAIYLNGSTRTNFENHIQYMADVHNFGDVDGNPVNTLQVVSDSELVTINGRLTVTKPIQTTTDTGTRMYTGLATGSHYNSTGFLILDTTIPSPNVSGNNMFSIHINGYSYQNASGGIIDLKVGTYSGESYFHNPSYTGSNIPDKWVNNIRFARKTATNTVSIILGDSGTAQPIEIAATLFIQGFSGVTPTYAEGWDWKISTNTNDYSSLTKVNEKSTKRPSFSATSSGFSVSTGWQLISDSMGQTHDGPDDNYNPSNGRFTPQLPGWYQFNFGGWAAYNSSTGEERYAVAFAKNGSLQYLAGGNYSAGDSPLAGAGQRLYLNGSTDYVELRGYSSVATTWGGGSHHVWWDGYWTGS